MRLRTLKKQPVVCGSQIADVLRIVLLCKSSGKASNADCVAVPPLHRLVLTFWIHASYHAATLRHIQNFQSKVSSFLENCGLLYSYNPQSVFLQQHLLGDLLEWDRLQRLSFTHKTMICMLLCIDNMDGWTK